MIVLYSNRIAFKSGASFFENPLAARCDLLKAVLGSRYNNTVK
jgi:hypothetical protein